MIIVFTVDCYAAKKEVSKEIVSPEKEVVLTGLDVLKKSDYHILKNKRVGLITNNTGVDAYGESAIDLIYNSKDVKLIRLFSPEHGIRGEADEKVNDQIDDKTSLQIISLYGKNYKPTPENLKDIDVLVYDIQDVGCRFYTYLGTLFYCMQAAADKSIEFVVLDRPNPVNGVNVSGFIPDSTMINKLTSIYYIPTRYGMTIGEIAKMFNAECSINVKLTVIAMENWKRNMYWEDTGVKWINPSPNMKTVNGAINYSEFGWIETTSLSMARGTDIPFEMFGAPYIDNNKLLKELKKYKIDGAVIETAEFIPTAKYHRFQNKKCYGVYLKIVDRNTFNGQRFGLILSQVLYNMYPKDFIFYGGFKTSVGSEKVSIWLKNGRDVADIENETKKGVENFKKVRKPYLLYQ